MIKVYFETSAGYAEYVAIFFDEYIYVKILPMLEQVAKSKGFDYVTESIEDEKD